MSTCPASFETTDEAQQLAGLNDVLETIDTPEGLVMTIAGGMFSEHPTVWRECKTRLAKHPDEKVAAFFRSERRKYFEIENEKKLSKLVDELDGLGIDRRALIREVIRIEAARTSTANPTVLAVALAIEGNAESTFAQMAGLHHVALPNVKKLLPPGLGQLRSLRSLSIVAASLTSDANIDELATVPQPFALRLSVKKLRLKLFDACKENVRALSVDGFAALTDIAPLASWPKLEKLEISGNGVSDLSPLAGLPIQELDLAHTLVEDLSVLAQLPLRSLKLHFAKTTLDLTPLREHPTLERISLWQSPVRWLEPLVSVPNLVDVRLDPHVKTWPGVELLESRASVNIVR